jgi:hypothetical protein
MSLDRFTKGHDAILTGPNEFSKEVFYYKCNKCKLILCSRNGIDFYISLHNIISDDTSLWEMSCSEFIIYDLLK